VSHESALADATSAALLASGLSSIARSSTNEELVDAVIASLGTLPSISAGLVVLDTDPRLVRARGDSESTESLAQFSRNHRSPEPDLDDLPANISMHLALGRYAPPARIWLMIDERTGSGELAELHTAGAAIGDAVAVSLDRIHLEDEVRRLQEEAGQRFREVSTIYEIGQAIDSVEIGRLLDIITEKAARVMGAHACSLMKLDPETNALGIAASYGLSEDVVFVAHRAMGEGIAGRVAATGEPMLIGDGQEDPRLTGLALRPEIGSSIIVPMKDETGSTLGVLSISRRRPAPSFTKSDLRLFSVFASQAALAINNKQLYDDLTRHVKELSTLSDLTQAVISNLDLNRLLNDVADNIIDVVNFDRCCIFLYDRPSRRFMPRIVRGYRQEGITRAAVRMGQGVVGMAARRKMMIMEQDARTALQPMRGFARSLGTNAFLAVPIVSNPVISKGQTIGVVVADNKLSGRSFNTQSIELLTTFVNQAGIAIENAQLYEDWQQRYQDINRLATQTDNILRSIGMTVVVVDANGIVTRWNRAGEEMWGISDREATDKPYAEVVERFRLPEAEASNLVSWMEDVRSTGHPRQRYKVTLHSQRRGQVVVNLLFSPLIDRHGERQGVVLIIEDVTHETRMESEIGRIRRLADIGQLAAKMAHEVRNPLSSIKGAAQLMRNEYEDLAPFREFLDIIIDEVNHLSKITTDLLDFARPLQLDLKWASLNDVVERTFQLFREGLREARVKVRFRPDANLPQILCDPKQLEQVVRNILINAMQAMPSGGDLAVRTYHDIDQGTVTACFCDTGVGIPEQKFEDIFQPFMTTKTKGTGLGLSIVKRIVENHHGSIDLTSRIGEGACFSITLPVRTEYQNVAEQTQHADGADDITLDLPDH
jgi:PAS domain S-box-containing protein